MRCKPAAVWTGGPEGRRSPLGDIAAKATTEGYGIMTFVVNQDGAVYQSDLGDDTAKTASALNAFNPDAAWAEVKGRGPE